MGLKMQQQGDCREVESDELRDEDERVQAVVKFLDVDEASDHTGPRHHRNRACGPHLGLRKISLISSHI